MIIEERLSREVETVGQETPIVAVAQRMRDQDVGVVAVLDGDRLAGVCTDRDIVVRCVADGLEAAEVCVRDVMSVEVLCCFGDDDVRVARDLMLEHGVNRLPVVDREHRLMGVVSGPELNDDPVPRTKSVKVTFHKEKTDARGRPHKVPVKTVYITSVSDRAAAEAIAVRKVEEQAGTTWTNVATGFEAEEEARKAPTPDR